MSVLSRAWAKKVAKWIMDKLDAIRVVIEAAIKTILGDGGDAPDWNWNVEVLNKHERIVPMDITLSLDQQCRLTARPKKRDGTPAIIADPVWASSDETAITVSDFTDDGAGTYSCLVDTVAVPPVGSPVLPRVTLSGDSDLGAGVIPISGSCNVTVVPGVRARTIEFEPSIIEKP